MKFGKTVSIGLLLLGVVLLAVQLSVVTAPAGRFSAPTVSGEAHRSSERWPGILGTVLFFSGIILFVANRKR